MKKTTVFYWISTILFALSFVMSAFMYLSRNEQIAKGFELMGLPNYLIPFLGVAKLLGAIGILQPVNRTVNEWAYAGLGFNLIGAIYIHAVFGLSVVMPLLFLLVLALSYFLYKRRYEIKAGPVAYAVQ